MCSGSSCDLWRAAQTAPALQQYFHTKENNSTFALAWNSAILLTNTQPPPFFSTPNPPTFKFLERGIDGRQENEKIKGWREAHRTPLHAPHPMPLRLPQNAPQLIRRTTRHITSAAAAPHSLSFATSTTQHTLLHKERGRERDLMSLRVKMIFRYTIQTHLHCEQCKVSA